MSNSRWSTIASTLTNVEGARAKDGQSTKGSAVMLKSVSILMATARRASGKSKSGDGSSGRDNLPTRKKVHRKLSKLGKYFECFFKL